MVEKNSRENILFKNYGLYGGEGIVKRTVPSKNYGLYGGGGIVKRTSSSKTTGCMVEEE